jgi:hypothetical protein
MKSSKFVVAAVGLAGALCAGAAMAHDRDDVQWSVTIGSDYGAPQYYRPAPVYVQPAYPAPAYAYRHYREPTRWDVDGDGIPNRYDRLYNPRWDRDGDGIPNWQDRHDNRRDGWGR